MEMLTCQMANTGELHPTVPNLFRYKCQREDCQRYFWSYTDNIKISCRHKRNIVETVVAKTKQLFTPKPRTRQERRAAASKKRRQPGITPPSAGQKLWNISQSLAEWAAEPGNVSKEAYEKRLQTCNDCPFLRDTSCGICGCFIAVKAKAKAWHCPAFKWDGDIGTDQVKCVIPLQTDEERQDLVMLMQNAQMASRITVLDCIGDYVPFGDERVMRVSNIYDGLRENYESYETKPYAIIVMMPRARGTNVLPGLLWAQQLADAGIVMPVHSATKTRAVTADPSRGKLSWRPVPTVSSDMFLITTATIDKLGMPEPFDDFMWSMQSYSLRARMSGISVVEAWTCAQQQDPKPLLVPSAETVAKLAAYAGPFWDILLTDSRVRLPDTPSTG